MSSTLPDYDSDDGAYVPPFDFADDEDEDEVLVVDTDDDVDASDDEEEDIYGPPVKSTAVAKKAAVIPKPPNLSDDDSPVFVPWRAVWDDPNLFKKTDDVTSKKFWICGHCECHFPTWNATKAKAHVAKVTNYGIKACKGAISKSLAAIYNLQWQEVMEKRKKIGVIEGELNSITRRADAVDLMVSKGTSRVAVSVARTKPSAANRASNNPLGTNGSPFFSVSDVTLDDSTNSTNAKPKLKPTPKLNNQMFLTTNHPSSAEASLHMDYLVTAFILEGGLPFSTVLNPNLKRLISQARMLPSKYTLPTRQKIGGPYMDILYDQRLASNEATLLRDKEIFGLGFYCDGATIKKTPLYNFLACGAHMPHAVLEIKDCSHQMAIGGSKDAKFISDVMIKHINHLDPYQIATDIVLFDGASNVQKAGRILENHYPRVTCVHGAEHVVSLFFSDVAKTVPGMLLKKLYSKIYAWFGGSHHATHAMFMAHSRKANGGHLVGLMRPSDTRMAGHWICWTRVLRHKQTLQSLVHDPAFLALKREARPPIELIEFLKNKSFWAWLTTLLRCMYGPLRLLRLADTKSAAMDKLYYFVLNTDKWLADHHGTLDDWETMDSNLFIRDLEMLCSSNCRAASGYASDHSECEDDMVDDTTVDTLAASNLDYNDMKFGMLLRCYWNKRREKMSHDFAITAWLLSPCPEIRAHVKEHLQLEHKMAAERMLLNEALLARRPDP
jgi:hypothetical protein